MPMLNDRAFDAFVRALRKASDRGVIRAGISAYENAETVALYTDDETAAHQAGVRDVMVRLDLYDAFCTEIELPIKGADD